VNSLIGSGLVLLGLVFAALAAVGGLYTGLTRREAALPWVQRAIYAFGVCMIAANVWMVKALLQHDFSVKYVAQVGSLATPTLYTIVSLWSSLEGSILFWGGIMGVYLIAFTFVHRKEHGRYMQLALGMMAIVACFFAFLIASPADPWVFLPNPPTDGPGPNPLLQNNPPMLYLGFVGMTVPFGIATGALLRGEIGDAWMGPLRRWTLIPWLFLTIGIILGAWWAYAVLGWGGFWAWDPVENASFMPWLAATAFMHSTMVTERRKSLKLWTLALALSAFLLTILGTFMTRSGIFNSVHAFGTSDVGKTFLIFFFLPMSAFCLFLLAFRGRMLEAETRVESLISREGAIFFNNLFFAGITFVVLIGTTFPMVVEALQNRRLSVGEPYFNTTALPLALCILFLMGVGPMLPWGAADPATVRRQLIVPGVGALIGIGISMAFGYPGPMPLATFACAGFVTVITLRELMLPAQARMAEQKESPWKAVVRSASRTPRRFGGYVVHLGVVVVCVAIASYAGYKKEASATLRVNQTLGVGDYKIRYDGLASAREQHREWVGANVTIIDAKGREIKQHGVASPRLNYYPSSNRPVESPAVHEMITGDVYVTLVAFDNAAGTATLNTYVFPMVGWIWYSMPLFVIGTLVALWPRRKAVVTRAAEVPAVAAAAPPNPT
jgi:cytochrome c-type biogenesis protein CcmF